MTKEKLGSLILMFILVSFLSSVFWPSTVVLEKEEPTIKTLITEDENFFCYYHDEAGNVHLIIDNKKIILENDDEVFEIRKGKRKIIMSENGTACVIYKGRRYIIPRKGVLE